MSIYWSFYILAWLAGLACFSVRSGRCRVSIKVVCDVAILSLPLGLAGGHLFFALVEPSHARPFEGFFLSPQGWTWGYISFGGVLGALCALAIVARLHRLPLALLADLAAPSLFLASAFGRIGCFLHGCCYGIPTSMPWGIRFARATPADPQAALTPPSHPVQLYEVALSAAAFLLLVKLADRTSVRPGGGTALALSLLAYFAIRFALEFFRIGATSYRISLGLSLTQILALVGGTLCVLVLHVRKTRTKRASLSA